MECGEELSERGREKMKEDEDKRRIEQGEGVR